MSVKVIINNTLLKEEKSSLLCQKGLWLYSRCEVCGTEYLHHTSCNREDCLVCGKEGSYAHLRRYTRGLKRVFWMYEKGKIGYLVITFPIEKREELKEKQNLKKTEKYIIGLLKREIKGIIGITRWHWAGDKSKKWHPHLNILFTAGYIEEKRLERIKKLIEKKLKSKVIYYKYSEKIKKVLHWWRYITRPTFLLQSEVNFEKIRGLKNVVYFGNWKGYKEYCKNLGKMDRKEWLKYVKQLFNSGYFEKNLKFMNLFIVIHKRCVLCLERVKYKVLKGWNEVLDKRRMLEIGYGYYVLERVVE